MLGTLNARNVALNTKPWRDSDSEHQAEDVALNAKIKKMKTLSTAIFLSPLEHFVFKPTFLYLFGQNVFLLLFI